MALPPGNRTSEGRWFSDGDVGHRVASVEEGLAGPWGYRWAIDSIFASPGRSSRSAWSGCKLDWDSMRVNFFVLTPGVLETQPASYITSFHLPPEGNGVAAALVERFPTSL